MKKALVGFAENQKIGAKNRVVWEWDGHCRDATKSPHRDGTEFNSGDFISSGAKRVLS